MSSTSDYFIKWGTSSNPAVLVCSQDYVELFPSGTSYTYTNSSPGFTGTRYYILVVLGSDGARRYSNVVTVTGVAGTPSLQLANSMSFGQSNLITGNPYTFNTSVKNTGTGSFTGNFYLKQGSTVWIDWYNVTIAPGQTVSLSPQSYTPTSSGNNLSLTLFSAPTGVSTGTQVAAGNYSNPVYVNVCQQIQQPALSSPSNGQSISPPPNSITYSWIKNNASGVATYKLKIRDISTGTNGPIIFEQNIGDVSSYSHTYSYSAGSSYRWVIYAVGGCNQEDDSPAWDFSIAGTPSLQLASSMSFGQSNLITGNPYTFNASVKNIGTGSFTGNFYLKQGSTVWIDWYNVTIAPGQTVALSPQSYTPTSSGNNLPLILSSAPTGVTTGTQVAAGIYSNPIYINVCQQIQQPALSSPSNGQSISPPPNSITYSWIKNNASGVATYKLKIRDITTGTNGPIIFEQNIGDVSSYSHTYSYSAGSSYRWVIYAVGGCNQEDDSPAWDFSITGTPNLVLWSNMGFGTSNLITETIYTFSGSIKNTGTGTFTGALHLKQGANDWIHWYSVTIAPNQTLTLPTKTYTPVTPGNNLPVTLYYQITGATDGYPISAGNYTNPIYVNVCQLIHQPALSSPSNNQSITPPPNSITYSWVKNNASGIATYRLKIRDITTDPTNGPVIFDQNVGDVSSYTHTYNYSAGSSYRWVIYAVGGCNQEDDSPAWEFSIAGTPNLVLWSNISFGASTLITGTTYTFSGSIKNTGTGTWSGYLHLKQGSNDWIHWYNVTISPNQVLTLPTKTYTPLTVGNNLPVTLHYQTGGIGDGYPIAQGSYQNPIYVNVVTPSCSFTDCNSPTNCGDVDYDDQVYEAVQYLCSHKIISGVNGAVLPDNTITRAAVAKIAFYGIFGDSTATPALGTLFSDNLPSPYADLQDPTRYYYRAAKCLLYLQYGDSITPFDRDRNNFLPSGTIARWQVLKVLLEAFNIAKDDSYTSLISMSQGDPGYGYVHRAFDLGITTQSNFYPNTACTRGQAFLFLRRILNLVTQGTIPAPSTATGNFYLSGLIDLRSLASAISMETGNFNHYTKSSFSIPGRNVSMNFDHSYNSYLTEMPKELFPIQPLGPGWTHSYNSYIIQTIAEATEDIRWMVLWPDGSIHSYKKVSSSYICETEGIYDQFYEDDANQFRIVTKNKINYTFNRTGTNEAAWMLTTIKDRNNNTLTINYIAGPSYTNPDGVSKTTRKVNYVSDPAGRQLNFYYTNTNAGLLTKVSDPLSRNIEFFYTDDNLSSFEDAKNQTTQYTYYTYPQGPPLLKKITLPKGNYITNTYKNRKLRYSKPNTTPGTLVNLDPSNYSSSGSSSFLKTTVTDPEGVIAKYDFNNRGRNTKLYGNASTDITTSYSISGQPWLPSLITNNKTGISVSMSYDGQGNPTQVTTSGGGTTINEYYQYNSFNDITQYTDGKGLITNYTYNANGNLTQVQNPLGHTITYTNNGYGQVTSITSPSNVITNFGYNANGNLNSTSLPALGLNSSQNFDNASRLTSSVNLNGQTTSYLYDNNDNMTRETNAMNYETNYAYDDNDNLLTITNAKNVPTSLSYDSYDRLINVGFVGANKVYTYNDDGSINTFTDPNNHTFTYTYDSDGRMTNDGYATFTYDPTTSNLKTIVKDGKTITYNYDGLNRISNIAYSDFSGNIVHYTYDNNDNITSIKYPGNKIVNYIYDNANRLTQVTDWNNASTTYTYRPDNQLLTITYPNAVKCSNSYDNAGRMTGMEYKRNNGSGSSIASYTFSLDNVSNHTQEQITEPYTAYPSMPTQNISYTYNTANRIQTAGSQNFGYDNNGNTTSKTGYTYTYDTRNNITSINGNYTQNYEYDGLGNRRKKGNTRFVLDILGMSQVLMETDLSGNAQNYYIYGLGLISRINSSNTTSYYISDFRGSTVAMTDATTNATITHKYQYDDFGKVLQFTEADFNPFRYVGKYGVMFEDSLHYFMRARYYDPAIGRFMSEDPVWSINLFPYGNNNPIKYIDPKGTWVEVAMLAEEIAEYLGKAAINYYYGQKMENQANKYMKLGDQYSKEGKNLLAMSSYSNASTYAKEAANLYNEAINDIYEGTVGVIESLALGAATQNLGKNLINSLNSKLTSMGMKYRGKGWYFVQNIQGKTAVNMKSQYLKLLNFTKDMIISKIYDAIK